MELILNERERYVSYSRVFNLKKKSSVLKLLDRSMYQLPIDVSCYNNFLLYIATNISLLSLKIN